MGISCISYFKVMYGMIKQQARNKNEGIALEKAEKVEQEVAEKWEVPKNEDINCSNSTGD